MRKRSILFLTLLAVGAFFARSPEAARAVRELVVQLRAARSTGREIAGRAQAESSKPASAQPDWQAYVALSAKPVTNAAPGPPDASAGENELTEDDHEVTGAVAAVADSDLRHALESSLTDKGTNAAEFRELLLRRWAGSDPKAAALWSSSVQNAAIASSATKQVAAIWADNDLSAALDWAKAMQEGPPREAAIVAIGYEAARTNSLEAFDLAASLPPSSERDALLLHFVRQWSAVEPGEAVDWASRVPDTGLREQLLSAAAITAATQDPRGAASLIARNLTPGRLQDQAAVAIVERWAQTDPQAAAAWISQFPEGSVKAVASQALALIQTDSNGQTAN
jgi:hypothetical protein